MVQSSTFALRIASQATYAVAIFHYSNLMDRNLYLPEPEYFENLNSAFLFYCILQTEKDWIYVTEKEKCPSGTDIVIFMHGSKTHSPLLFIVKSL